MKTRLNPSGLRPLFFEGFWEGFRDAFMESFVPIATEWATGQLFGSEYATPIYLPPKLPKLEGEWWKDPKAVMALIRAMQHPYFRGHIPDDIAIWL